MNIRDLSEETRQRITKLRFDRIIEKHEGPFDWSWWIDEADFLEMDGRSVLFPVPREDHANIQLVRSVVSRDEETLTLFLRDTTYDSDPMFAGRLAVCERFPGTSFYVAMVYHEWYAVPFLAESLAR